jgi:hypothetical protein
VGADRPAAGGGGRLLQDPVRPLAASLLVRAWLTAAVRLGLALPVLAATCRAQLWLAAVAAAASAPAGLGGTGVPGPGVPAPGLPGGGVSPAPLPWPGLAAEFAAGCAIALAAALVARGRWQDLDGAVAAPAALAVIAAVAVLPLHLLPTAMAGLTAAQRQAWIMAGVRWTGVAAAAAGVGSWGRRDQWDRLRILRHRAQRRA